MAKRLIVFSADAMVGEDLALFRTLPNYRRWLLGGAEVKRVRSIYPSLTHPAHVSMAGGNYPDRHGLTLNYHFTPGVKSMPWVRLHDTIKGRDIFDAAKTAGLKTAAVFWSASGRHPSIDYNVYDYGPGDPGGDAYGSFVWAGASEETLEIVRENWKGPYNENWHPGSDIFKTACACSILKRFKPELLLVHTDPIDGARHQYGVFNEKVNEAIIETDRYIGLIMEAAQEAGVAGETALFLVSDHGQLEIKRNVNINVLLADYGLIRTDGEGRVSGWDAYCVANGMSAAVFLKNREDFALFRKVHGLLRFLRDEGVYGIGEVYTERETMSKERLGGDFSFILETDGYTSFGDDWLRPLVKGFDSSDYRYGRATHGYLPEKGPQPFLLAKGPGIRNGAVLEKASLVDEAPTFARVLGLALPDTDGRILDEILEPKEAFPKL